MSTLKLAAWTVFVASATYLFALAVAAPQQAEARAQVDGVTDTTTELPTRQVDIEAAYHACSRLTDRLEADLTRQLQRP